MRISFPSDPKIKSPANPLPHLHHEREAELFRSVQMSVLGTTETHQSTNLGVFTIVSLSEDAHQRIPRR